MSDLDEKGMEKKPLEEIATLEEANAIMEHLTVRIREIGLQLEDDGRKTDFIWEFGEEEYQRWVAAAKYARFLLITRQRKLRLFIKATWTGFVNTNDLPANILTALGYAWKNGLNERDVLLFLANPHIVRMHANVLDEARMLASTAAPQARAQMLCQLARITRDEQELNKIVLLWKQPGETHIVHSDIGRWLIIAYLAFGKHAEAESVMDEIPLPGEAAYAGIRIFQANPNDGLLKKIRKRIRQERQPVEQFTLFGELLEQSRSTDDLRPFRKMFQDLMQKAEAESQRRHIVSVFVRAQIQCGCADDAYKTIAEYAPDDPATLFRVARATKKREDLLTALGKKLPDENRRGVRVTLINGIEACFACNAPDLARTIAAAATEAKTRVNLWCRVAEEAVEEGDIERGEAALAALPPVDTDWARERLVQGLLKRGRIDEARKHLLLFTQDMNRYGAYLRIYCAENRIEYPKD